MTKRYEGRLIVISFSKDASKNWSFSPLSPGSGVRGFSHGEAHHLLEIVPLDRVE